MSYTSVVEQFPAELQFPVMRLVEAVTEDLRGQLAVRREDFAGLQMAVIDLGAAQRRSEERISRLEVVMVELAEAQKRTEERINELTEAQKRTEERVNELAEAQKRTEERVSRLETAVAELIEAQKRTEAAIQRLTGELYDVKFTVAGLVGDNLERRYREKAYAYFGSILRRVQVVPLPDIEAQIEQRLTDGEMDELAPLDLLVRGLVKQHADKPEVWLAVEVSSKVDRNDIRRAVRRAALLRKAGLRAIPTVAGNEMTGDAQELVQRERVLVVQDGQKQFWDQALAEALAL